MIDCLIVFRKTNRHWMGRLLNKQRRHVCCAILDPRGYWVEYDYSVGVPKIRVLCSDEDDPVQWYKDHGCEVIPYTQGRKPTRGWWMFNNCVSHVKAICAIQAPFCWTPHALYKHLGGK